MRRVTRLRQPRLLLLSSAPTHTHAQLLAPAARTLSTTPSQCADAPKRNRLREMLWKGPAPGPEDPYASPESRPSPASLERSEIEAYEAELAELQANAYDFGLEAPATGNVKAKRPASRLKTEFKRTKAPEQKQAVGYSPAVSAEGLEEIGGYEGWWDMEGHWGKESNYNTFAPVEKVENADVIEVMLRQALVEALAIRREKLDDRLARNWPRGDRAAMDRAFGLRVKMTEDGIFALRGNTNAVAKALVPSKRSMRKAKKEAPKGVVASEGVEQPETAVEETPVEAVEAVESEDASVPFVLSADEARELTKTWEAGWKNVSLADPVLKFAVHKRMYQLTGHLVPDAKLARVETVNHLFNILVRPASAEKVLETIQHAGSFELPNVKVYERRVTPIDREKETGRWKLIEEELKKRNLPVTGHEGLEGHKEVRWQKGGV